MKLETILESNLDIERSKESPEIVDGIDDLDLGGKLEKLGQGTFAVVYATDPGTAMRVTSEPRSLLSLKHDGYLSYVSEINKRNASDNPYLPTVYSVKFYASNFKDMEGEDEETNQHFRERNQHFKYTVELEKLHDFEQVINFGDQGDEHIVSLLVELGKRMFHRFEGEDVYSQSAYSVFKEIVKGIKGSVNGYGPKIKDDKLKEAIKVIRSAQQSSETELDFFESNVMFRLTSVGPQFVIVDPLFG